MSPLETRLWEKMLFYTPMMYDTLDPRYQARVVPGHVLKVRGAWVANLNFDLITPTP